MSISYVAAGSLVSGTVSGTPGLPGGVSDGDLLIMQVISGHPSESSPVASDGWVEVDTFSGGGGSWGAAAGPRRITYFVKEYTTGDAAPTVTIDSDTGTFIAAQIFGYSRSAGTAWRYAMVYGEDTSSGTSFSSGDTDAITWNVDDFVHVGYGVPISTATTSAEGITAAGVTFSAITERADTAVTDGYDCRFVAANGSVTAGDVSILANITATFSAAETGVAAVLRMRESYADLIATSQGSTVPRVLVSASGLSADDIESVTLQRVANGETLTVRGADAIDVSADAFVRTDGENPFGTTVYYQLLATDVQGSIWTVTSNTVQQDITYAMLSDALTGEGVEVQVVSHGDVEYTRASSVFNVNGRIIAVVGPRASGSRTLIVTTLTNADRRTIQSLLDDASNGIIQLRQQPATSDQFCGDADDDTDTYLSVQSDVFSRNGRYRSPTRRISLSCIEVDAWPLIFEARGSTLQDIADYYVDQTLQQIADDFVAGTLLSIAEYDWTV